MSTIVCQKIFTCYETEKTAVGSATVKLEPPGEDQIQSNRRFDNWSFINETFYLKSGFSGLSAKSLELCTENLGSETGSETSSPPYSPTGSGRWADSERWVRPHRRTERKTVSNFPPPLMTMSGASTLQVRRRREEGRLIIEAVEAPFRNAYLQAERTEGRLKLSFPTSTTDGSENSDDETEETDEETEIQLETEKFPTPSRCKDNGHGNKQLSSHTWEPSLWVVTS